MGELYSKCCGNNINSGLESDINIESRNYATSNRRSGRSNKTEQNVMFCLAKEPDPECLQLYITNLNSNIHWKYSLYSINYSQQTIDPNPVNISRPVCCAGICYQRNTKLPSFVHNICKKQRKNQSEGNNYNVIFRTGGVTHARFTENSTNLRYDNCEAIILDTNGIYDDNSNTTEYKAYISGLASLPYPKYGHDLVFSKQFGLITIGGLNGYTNDPEVTSTDILQFSVAIDDANKPKNNASKILESVKYAVDSDTNQAVCDYQVTYNEDDSNVELIDGGVLSEDDAKYDGDSNNNDDIVDTADKWKKLTSLPSHGRGLGMGVVLKSGNTEKGLMVFGGMASVKTGKCVKTAIFYDFETCKWNDLASFKGIGRWGSGKCYDDNNDNVCMCGAGNESLLKAMKDCQYYNVYKNEWYILPNTNFQHVQPEMWIQDHNILYVADVFNGMEWLDLRTKKWSYTDKWVSYRTADNVGLPVWFGIKRNNDGYYKLLK